MRTNKLYAVIHTLSPSHALVNAAIAKDGGADGVFVIDHSGGPAWRLRNCYSQIREEFPNWWVGLNFLKHPASALGYSPRNPPQALWFDSIGYDESSTKKSTEMPEWIHKTLMTDYGEARPLIFGGFNFKHQDQIADVPLALKRLGPFVDVITTSGPATGSPPTVEKLALLREQAGPETKIAVASGMTPENVDPFLEYVDYFLVATGINKDFHNLDPVKVRQMTDKMRR